MSASPHAEAGIVTGLIDLPLPFVDTGVPKKEAQVVGELLQACFKRVYAGICYTDEPRDACSELRHSAPERSLLGIAAVLIRNSLTVRFVPMARVGEYLNENDENEESWGPLRAPWLIVPDFHVRGPKGFGLEPWLLDDLTALLKWRLGKRYPTILYAADPWALNEKIGSLFNRHYAFVIPSEVVDEPPSVEVADIPPPFEV